jgi:hypothetical protein
MTAGRDESTTSLPEGERAMTRAEAERNLERLMRLNIPAKIDFDERWAIVTTEHHIWLYTEAQVANMITFVFCK